MNDIASGSGGLQSAPSESGLSEAAPVTADTSGLLEALLAISDDCIKVLDLDGQILFINRGGIEALELGAASHVVGCSWYSFWNGAGREDAANGVERARNGKNFEFMGEAATAKGSPRYWHVKVTPILDRDQVPVRILVQSRNISSSRIADQKIANLVTQTRASEDELRVSEAKFRAIADTMPQMVWSTLPDGFHDYFNARWYDFTGVAAGSTDGEGWNNMFHPDDRDRAFERWRHSLSSGEPYEIEYRLRHHSGEYRWTLGRALPIRDGAGVITRWFGTCTDIHATKRDAELLSLLSQELSHRIKNIFAIVQGLIGLSARHEPASRGFADTLRERVAALGRAHDFARPHSEESRPVVGETTLHALMREILKPYPAMDEGRIIVTGTDLAVDDKSATPIALVIHELATNAMKYGALSSPTGRILIETSQSELACNVSWQENGGPGISGKPAKNGFGTQLSTVSVNSHLGGTIERNWQPGGLLVSITCPISALRRA